MQLCFAGFQGILMAKLLQKNVKWYSYLGKISHDSHQTETDENRYLNSPYYILLCLGSWDWAVWYTSSFCSNFMLVSEKTPTSHNKSDAVGHFICAVPKGGSESQTGICVTFSATLSYQNNKHLLFRSGKIGSCLDLSSSYLVFHKKIKCLILLFLLKIYICRYPHSSSVELLEYGGKPELTSLAEE